MDINIGETERTSKKKMIALELPEDLYQRLRKEAFDRETSLSAMIRCIVYSYFLDKEQEEQA